ncbi:hypothetical protein ABDX87_09625 [Pseudomonas abietaniphila]|uniref:hypothetical protein n=1 Tax=Pseudomonas abietaniphila TaxID=89065 RepID=UPI0032174E44
MFIESSQQTRDSNNLLKKTNTHNATTPSFSEILDRTLSSRTDSGPRNLAFTCAKNDILTIARSDPEAAKRLAHDYTYNSLGSPLLDLSDRPNIRYSLTGELVTAETAKYFQQISQAMQKQCETLYRQELSKGTPAVEILEKIFSVHDAMPTRFKEMLGI